MQDALDSCCKAYLLLLSRYGCKCRVQACRGRSGPQADIGFISHDGRLRLQACSSSLSWGFNSDERAYLDEVQLRRWLCYNAFAL
jgi:hypothetical protein